MRVTPTVNLGGVGSAVMRNRNEIKAPIRRSGISSDFYLPVTSAGAFCDFYDPSTPYIATPASAWSFVFVQSAFVKKPNCRIGVRKPTVESIEGLRISLLILFDGPSKTFDIARKLHTFHNLVK